ncbi:MAG: SIMPL domain-containing protein [Pseudomonadota bacterium]
MKQALLGLVITLSAGALWADSHDPSRDLVHLSVTASEEVENDLLVARLYVEKESAEQSTASSGVNETMIWALAQSKQMKDLKQQTIDYRTSPIYDKRRVVGWRVRQSLYLESANSDGLSELLAVLQSRMAIESVGHNVSDGAREKVESRLIDVAIARFKERAERIAKNFDHPNYDIVSVNVNTNRRGGQPMMMGAQMRSVQAEAGPAFDGGTRGLEVSVNGTIQLAQ